MNNTIQPGYRFLYLKNSSRDLIGHTVKAVDGKYCTAERDDGGKEQVFPVEFVSMLMVAL